MNFNWNLSGIYIKTLLMLVSSGLKLFPFNNSPFSRRIVAIFDGIIEANRPYKEQVNKMFYRGSQLKINEIKDFIEKTGIKTIINLKIESKKTLEKLKKECEKYDIIYENIPIDPFNKPSLDQIREIIRVIDSNSDSPIYVHCLFGEDRTGLVAAIYRIRKQKWSFQEAFNEMKSKGYKENLFPGLRDALFELYKESYTVPAA